MKLDPKAFGLSLGLLTGAWWLLAMGQSLLTNFGTRTLMAVGKFHPLFSWSWGGLLWMVALHLVAGAVMGWVFVMLYNKLMK